MTGTLANTWASIVGSGLIFGQSDNDSGNSVGDSNGRPPQHNARAALENETNTPHSQAPLLPIDGIPVETLVAQLQQGSQDALATCYRSLHTPLWRMAIVLTHSRDHADEIVQDAFLSLWGRHAHLPLDLDLRAYLYAAVRNLAKQRARHHAVVIKLEQAVSDGVVLTPAFGHNAPNPATAAETGDFYAAFHRALTLLKDRERIALRLRLEDELTFEQIGTILGISKMGAQKIVLRAEHKIRELLAQYRD